MFANIKLENEFSITPKKAHEQDSGFDIFCCENGLEIAPHQWKAISVGFSIELPFGYEAIIRPRSGLALHHGITVLNSPGTIDENYRGIIKVILINHSNINYIISYGERIAQMIIQKKENINLLITNDLSSTKRGANGFGSTGK